MAPVTRNRGTKGGRLSLAAVGMVAALGLAGCSLGDDGPEEEPAEETAEPVDAAPLLEEVVADLAAYPALTADGQIAESVGGEVQETTLTVADGGAANGTVTANDVEADLAAADGKLFLRAAEEFWLDKGVFGPDSDQFDDSWVRASVGQAGINPSSTLAPPALAAIIEEIGVADDEAVEENLDDTLAYKVDLNGERNQLWVDAETNQILRIEIEELVPEEGESGPQVRLDLAEAGMDEAEALYTSLTNTAEEELDGSRDARIEVSWDGQPEMECDDGPLCTWSGTVRDAGADGGGSVLVRMDVTFTNEEIGDEECSDSGALEAGGTLNLSCDSNYNIVSDDQQTYEVEGEARLSTRGLSANQQEEMLAALAEQQEATLAGGEEEPAEGEGDEEPAEGEGAEEDAEDGAEGEDG